jgi:hypothetical protein
VAGHETATDDKAGAGADGDVDEHVHGLLVDLGEDVLAQIDASTYGAMWGEVLYFDPPNDRLRNKSPCHRHTALPRRVRDA